MRAPPAGSEGATGRARPTRARGNVIPPPLVGTARARGSVLGQPRGGARGRPASASAVAPWEGARGGAVRDTQAGVPSAWRPGAQLAFKDSMVHGILQFTPCIAFRYVLHRCGSRDIRCRESFCWLGPRRRAGRPRTVSGPAARGAASRLRVPWRLPRRGGLIGARPGRRGAVRRARGPGPRGVRTRSRVVPSRGRFRQ